MQLIYGNNEAMNPRSRSMHVARIERRYNGKTYVTILLRRSFREGKAVKHETLGNLTHLPERLIEIVRRSLLGEEFASTSERFRILRSLPHGHVQAVLGTITRLGLDNQPFQHVSSASLSRRAVE